MGVTHSGHVVSGGLDPTILARHPSFKHHIDARCSSLVTARNTEYLISALRDVPPDQWKGLAPGLMSTLPRGKALSREPSSTGGRSALTSAAMRDIGISIWMVIFSRMQCHPSVPLTCRLFLAITLDPLFRWRQSPEFLELFHWQQPVEEASLTYRTYYGDGGGFDGKRHLQPDNSQQPHKKVCVNAESENNLRAVDVVHDAFFSTILLDLAPQINSIKLQVSEKTQNLALCWGGNGPCNCCMDSDPMVYNHGSLLWCLCFQPQCCVICQCPVILASNCMSVECCDWPMSDQPGDSSGARLYWLPVRLHCVRCIWDCGCRLGDQFCCVDLPTVSSYDRGARQAVDSNASEYLKLALHPYWESSLPPGIAAADEELPVVDMSEYSGFVPPDQLSFLAPLQENWTEVLREFEEATKTSPDTYIEWSDDEIHNDEAETGWRVFGLIAYGKDLKYNQSLAPVTTKLLAGIPNVNLAGFSTLAAGTHLLPHAEFDGTSGIRCHLGLKTVSGAVIRVEDSDGSSSTKSWAQGEWICFNGSSMHEAINNSDQSRTVLLLDFFPQSPDWDKMDAAIPDWLKEQISSQTAKELNATEYGTAPSSKPFRITSTFTVQHEDDVSNL